jgi:hypothetical protein
MSSTKERPMRKLLRTVTRWFSRRASHFVDTVAQPQPVDLELHDSPAPAERLAA